MNTTTQQLTDLYKIEIHHDQFARYPWEDVESYIPLMYKYGRDSITDLSNGSIYDFVERSVSDQNILDSVNEIENLFGYDFDFNFNSDDSDDDKLNIINDAIYDFIRESISNLAAYCELFNIKHFSSVYRGYSQGDYADVILVPTLKHCKLVGIEYSDITDGRMHSDFELFENWANGDVYGFKVFEKVNFTKTYANGTIEQDFEFKEIDSCWGFYGTDHEKSGLIDYVLDCIQDFSKSEILDYINNIEVIY